MAGGSALGKAPWPSLLRCPAGGGLFVEAFPRQTAVALTVAVATVLTTVAIAEAAAITITKTETPIVALAVTVGLAHHRGGALFVLVHANREVAQHILAEPLLSLDLVEGGRRRVDIEQGEMRLAVLAQTVGEGLHAPLLGLGELAAHLLDDGLELGGQFFNLLRAGVLAREEDVFVERHPMPFPCSLLQPGAKPFEPFRERLECSEGGNTGRRTISPAARHWPSSRPFSSQPGSSGSAGYTESPRKGKAVWNGAGAPAAPARLDRADVAVSYGPISLRGGNVPRFHISGPRQSGGRHGQGSRRRLCAGTCGVRGGRCGTRREAHAHHLGRAGRGADADRERTARTDGGVARGHAGIGSASGR